MRSIIGYIVLLLIVAGLYVALCVVGPEKADTPPPTTIYYTIPITPTSDSYWTVRQSDLLRSVPIYAHPYNYTRAVGLLQYNINNGVDNYYAYVYELELEQDITYQVGSYLFLTTPDARNVCHLYRQNVDLPNMKTLKVVE